MPYPTLRKSPFNSLLSGILLLGLAFFCFLMFRIIWPYTGGRTDIDFLLTKQHIVHLLHYRWAFYLHIFTSLFVLAAGLTQFSRRVLRNWRQVHRMVGKMYVFIVLFISGPAAFCMSLYGNGGWPARISFLLLSILWWWFTFTAYRKIRSGDVAGHRDFMIRSYALTFSAIMLRVFQFLLGYFTGIDPVEGYVLVAWASWLLNLAVAEGVIWRLNKQKAMITKV